MLDWTGTTAHIRISTAGRVLLHKVNTVTGGGSLQRYLLFVTGGVPATEPLRRGLNELSEACQHVLNTFEVTLNKHQIDELIIFTEKRNDQQWSDTYVKRDRNSVSLAVNV